MKTTSFVGGLLTATVLTLVVVPIVYTLMDDLAIVLRRQIFRWEEARVSPKPPSVQLGPAQQKRCKVIRA